MNDKTRKNDVGTRTEIGAYNNHLKNDLIASTYSEIPYVVPKQLSCVLDLVCGTGGDLRKFFYNNYDCVIGADFNPTSIETAESRVSTVGERAKPFYVEYHVCDISIYDFNCPFLVDTVIMNFALNYFFLSEKTLRQLFRNAAYSLKTNGVFAGIAYNGDLLYSLITDHYNTHRTNFIDLRFNEYGFTVEFEHLPQTDVVFGQKYKLTVYEKGREAKEFPEYLVHLHTLTAVAHEYGFDLMSIQPLVHEQNNMLFYYQFKFFFRKVRDIYKHESILQLSSTYPIIKYTYFIEHPTLQYSFDVTRLVLTPSAYLSNTTKKGSLSIVKLVHRFFFKQNKKNPRTMIDVFAYCGAESIAFALHMPSIRIASLDTDPCNMIAIQKNTALYNLTNIVAYQGTISSAFTLLGLSGSTQKKLDILYINTPFETYFETYFRQTIIPIVLKHIQSTFLIVLKLPLTFNAYDVVQNEIGQNMELKTLFNMYTFRFYNVETYKVGMLYRT